VKTRLTALVREYNEAVLTFSEVSMVNAATELPRIPAKCESELLSEWMELQASSPSRRADLISEGDIVITSKTGASNVQ
jgi:hypothetical protein